MDVFEQFYLDHQDADGNLTDAQMAQMLTLDQQGDTGTKLPETDVPDIDAAPAEAQSLPETLPVEATQPQPEPVVLAKDGVHTIPFEKLEEARQQAQHWSRIAAEKDAEIARLTADVQAPTQPAEGEATPQGEAVTFGDYSDEAMTKGVQAVASAEVAKAVAAMQAKFEQVLAPLKEQEQTTALEAHFKALTDANPDHNQIVSGQPLQDWIEKQPSFVRDQYKTVFERGTAAQVIELVSTFKSQSGIGQTAPTSAAQKAKDAIASAKVVRPTSLTDIPAGSSAHHDEAEAIREMTNGGLMAKFGSMSDPSKILAQLDRLV
jgi:hypothetical protein